MTNLKEAENIALGGSLADRVYLGTNLVWPMPFNITFGNSTTYEANSGLGVSITMNKPTGLANGDRLIAYWSSHKASATMTAPSGWTVIYTETSGSTVAFAVKDITSAGTEASTYTFGIGSGTNSGAGILVIVRGLDTTLTPLYASFTGFSGNSGNVTDSFGHAPATGTAVRGRDLVLCWAEFRDGTVTNSAVTSYNTTGPFTAIYSTDEVGNGRENIFLGGYSYDINPTPTVNAFRSGGQAWASGFFGKLVLKGT